MERITYNAADNVCSSCFSVDTRPITQEIANGCGAIHEANITLTTLQCRCKAKSHQLCKVKLRSALVERNYLPLLSWRAFTPAMIPRLSKPFKSSPRMSSMLRAAYVIVMWDVSKEWPDLEPFISWWSGSLRMNAAASDPRKPHRSNSGSSFPVSFPVFIWNW